LAECTKDIIVIRVSYTPRLSTVPKAIIDRTSLGQFKVRVKPDIYCNKVRVKPYIVNQ
jgi:hypothetical protein